MIITKGKPTGKPPTKFINLADLQLYENKIREYLSKPQNKQTNCPNCGAPITSCKCEYCGTKF